MKRGIVTPGQKCQGKAEPSRKDSTGSRGMELGKMEEIAYGSSTIPYMFHELPEDSDDENDNVPQVNLAKIENIMNERFGKSMRSLCKAQTAKQMHPLCFHVFALNSRFLQYGDTGSISELLIRIQNAIKSISAMVKISHRLPEPNILTQMPCHRPKRHPLQINVPEVQHLSEVVFYNCIKRAEIDGHADSWLVKREKKFVISGKYMVTFTALELSNNFGPPTTVFAIYKKPNIGTVEELMALRDVLAVPPKSILASGYAVYGVTTTLMLAFRFGIGCHQFILDQKSKQFLKVPGKITIPEYGLYYSLNEGDAFHFTSPTKELLQIIKNRAMVEFGKKYMELKKRSVRYTGSFIADVHFIVKKGGIAMDPSYNNHPNGKLSLQFKCNPIAFLVTKAEGLAINDRKAFEETIVESPFTKSAIYAGSVVLVKKLHALQKAKVRTEESLYSELYSHDYYKYGNPAP